MSAEPPGHRDTERLQGTQDRAPARKYGPTNTDAVSRYVAELYVEKMALSLKFV
jgi:hypothetical protein